MSTLPARTETALRRCAFEECYRDDILGLNSRMINFWLDSRESVAKGTLSNGDVEASIYRAFARNGYAQEAASELIAFLRSKTSG